MIDNQTSIFSKTNKKQKYDNLESDSLEKHQLLIEHMTGSYDLMQFVSKELRNGSKIKFNNNIIYLDVISSRAFYMGPSFNEEYNVIKNNEEKKVIKKFNSFICSKYNFITFINWEAAYIYKNYLYLVSKEVESNSKFHKNFKSFTLAIYCDDIEKLNIFNNSTEIDIRQLLVSVSIDGEEDNMNINSEVFAENRVVEKRIVFMILNENNKDILLKYSNKYFNSAHEQYKKIVSLNPDELIGGYYSKYSSQLEHYKINTSNNMQRDFDKEYSDFHKKDGE